MADTKFETRVKVSQIVKNQIPEFISSSEENFVEFLKQYYVSQEYRGSALDISSNFDQYLNLDNLTADIISKEYTLTANVNYQDDEIEVSSTVGFPDEYGLLKINNEIITYTGKTSNSFTGCLRGFSGIDSYEEDRGQSNLVFKSTSISTHKANDEVINLSNLFLKEFFRKLKYQFLPGLENTDFAPGINVGTFIKQSKSLFQTKGTDESFRILFKVLYGVNAEVIDTEDFLIKSSTAEFVRRKVLFARLLSGDNPLNIVGQSLISDDGTASAPVSEMDFYQSTSGEKIYRISIFEGYDDESLIIGSFKDTKITKVIGSVSPGADTVTVDSTIGFPKSGTFVTGNNTVTYTERSVNQFFNCSGIEEAISDLDEVASTNYAFSYENGDITKLVTLQIRNILSDFVLDGDYTLIEDNDPIRVNNLGEYIRDNGINNTYKEFIFNSWKYNTASRFEIESSSSNTSHVLTEYPTKNSLRNQDTVEIFQRGSNTSLGTATVLSITRNQANSSKGSLTLSNLDLLDLDTDLTDSNFKFDIRRVVKKVSSDSEDIPLKYSNILANVQNTYDESGKNIYVATNSLPDYTINPRSISEEISSLDAVSDDRIAIAKPDLEFLTGDRITYTHNSDGNPIGGLVSNAEYFIKIEDSNKIKLFTSLSSIVTDTYIKLSKDAETASTHKFTLSRLFSKSLIPSRSLRKFPLEVSRNSPQKVKTIPDKTVGTLINGVEIFNYKGVDKVYYGPIKNVEVLNRGVNYDVLYPPKIEIDNPTGIGGTTCLVEPVISGGVETVLLNNINVPIKKLISVTLTGGNGTGAVLEPVVERKHREVEFDATIGISTSSESISFTENHYFTDGQRVVYNSNGNDSIGIGTYGGSNLDQGKYLLNGGSYYVKYLTSKSISLYETLKDYNAGINTVGFTTINAYGTHKIRSFEFENILSDIEVVNSGSGYEYRNIIISPDKRSSSISTTTSQIIFENHGFSDGSIINYNSSSVISGLSTSQNYYVIKIDDDSFRIASSQENYNKNKYIEFSDLGGNVEHSFKYPPVAVDINVSYANTDQVIAATPVVRGEIVDIVIHESGSGYGSEVLNYENIPTVTVKTGKNAILSPSIVNGKIDSVIVINGGSEYFSLPDLVVTGSGSGAKLRPIINTTTGKLTGVSVIKGGIGYKQSDTIIEVKSVANGVKLNPRIRDLTINVESKFGGEFVKRIINSNDVTYTVLGYFDQVRESFEDNIGTEYSGSSHSPIIGWAYDGNPIYGPFGYSDPSNASTVKRIESSYSLDTTKVVDRPDLSVFKEGIFVEDYTFDGSGDLDENNGRFAKTPDFPKGTYAYFAPIVPDPEVPNTFLPSFPYFIGDTYRSLPLEGVLSQNQQNFDLQNSGVLRNTAPYRVGQKNSKNDYLDFTFDDKFNAGVIGATSSGDIESFEIVTEGFDYAVGDSLEFDDTNSGGSGVSAEISEVKGKDITSIAFTETKESNVVVVKESDRLRFYVDPYHTFSNNNYIKIDNESTNIKGLSGFHKISTDNHTSILGEEIKVNSGIVTDIFVSNVPRIVSVGNTIGIGTENMEILNVFSKRGILRVKRSISGIAHTVGSLVTYRPDSFVIPFIVNDLNSYKNNKVYFNPTQSVGIGTTVGFSTSVSYTINNITNILSLPTGSIYLPGHGFDNHERVTIGRPTGVSSITVYNNSSGSEFSLLNSAEETVFVIKKTDDIIGIVTSLTGIGYSDSGLSFITNGQDNYEYYIQSQNDQITVDAIQYNGNVSVSTSHGLKVDDRVTLNVLPNKNVGIGTSTFVKAIFNNNIQKILINPVGFNSTGINTTNNTITIPNNNFKTGDKVFYEADAEASGLTNDSYYYVFKISEDVIKLSETLYDINSSTQTLVSIAGTGGGDQKLSLVNPQINVVRNNNLVFDVSDSSFLNKTIQFFRDSNFVNRFVSTSEETTFNIVGVGTAGYSGSKITVNHTNGLNFDLYYAVKNESTDELILPDEDVKSFSRISYINSYYNDTFDVVGVATTSFTINLTQVPEDSLYITSDVDSFEYLTSSKTVTGPISKIRKISPGFNYKSLPRFTGVDTTNGDGASVRLVSDSIGKVENIEIKNSGYSFPTDKTLSPSGSLPIIVSLTENQKISNVKVNFGGNDYYSEPTLTLIDSETRDPVNTISFTVELDSNSISKVEPVNSSGLDLKKYELFASNNSNGVLIDTIEYSSSGIVTCNLKTPAGGFSLTDPPFAANQEIFIEGIEKVGTAGTGFNSVDVGYKFFTISQFQNTSPAKVVFDISEFTTNPGIALTNQTFASIIPKSKYPTFEVSLEESSFIKNEQLLVDIGNGFVLSENNIIKSDASVGKIVGTDLLQSGYRIKGRNSGSTAKISNITNLSGRFVVDQVYSTTDGWKNKIGTLSEDYQVLSDNDYYQKLAYSIKSPISYETFIDPVNKLVHSTGLKNFANLGITSSVSIGIGDTLSTLSLVVDYSSDLRVDRIRDFDTVKDVDVIIEVDENGSITKKAKYVEFQNQNLTDYFVCKSNRVLSIDNVENEFSSTTFGQEEYVDILTYPKSLKYSSWIVQSVGIGSTEHQVDDIVVLNDNLDSFTINRGSLSNASGAESYADVGGFIDQVGTLSLRYEPTDPFDRSYNIKVYRNYFDSTVTGLGTTSIGFVDMTGKVESVGIGSTAEIVGISTTSTQAFMSEIFVTDLVTNKMNFFEVAVVNDGQTSRHAEYFFDTEKLTGKSSDPFVSIGSTIESGILKLNLTNTGSNRVIYKTKTVNFNSPSVGLGSTYRFLAFDQPEGSERSVRLQSDHVETGNVSVGIGTTILSFDASTVGSVKSLIRIKNTDTDNTSIHQVLFLNDTNDTFIMPKFYVSMASTTGIGTFDSGVVGANADLLFYPDFTANYEISIYSQVLYSELDLENIVSDKEYGNIVESIKNSRFNAINGDGNDQIEFEMEYNGTPIFQKKFNPTDSQVLDLSTGVFSINDHFFSNNESVTYKPGSSFLGVAATAIGIGTTTVGGTAFTGDFIAGLSTITGISSSLLEFFSVGQLISGPSVPPSTEIVSIGNTIQYFVGDIVGSSSSTITGVANTSIFKVSAGIFSGDGTSLGTIQSIGLDSVTSDQLIDVGVGRTYYTDNVGLGISLSNVSTATTIRQSYTSGISTDICPDDVYIIKDTPNTFRITGTFNSGIGFTFTDTGSGNSHTLTMKKNIEKTLINVDGIVQYPIAFSPIAYDLTENITTSQQYLPISGISTINPTDLMKIDDEYVEIIAVGIGTSSNGPISGIGTLPLVKVKRSVVGSTAASHTSGTTAQIYRGSYNIVGNKLFFTQAPKGSGENDREDAGGLKFERSSFNGRVFLREDYTNNVIYDDLSSDFNGIGRTFTIKHRGQDVNYVEPGSGLLYVNEIFQTPTTSNNEGNNYDLVDNGNTTSLIFTGIKSPVDDSIITSTTDVNQNGVPRGGIIVSLGSTPGLGFAPLVGASVTAVVGAGGSIVSVGLGTTDHPGSGYNGLIGIAVTVFEEGHVGTAATITATVGLGGTLSFNVGSGGTGYTNPKIFVSDPSYSNLHAIGISRIGIGQTTDTGVGFAVNLEVGAASTTGIGSTYFEVTNFEVTNNGFGFKRGDKFTVVGLVTDASLSEPVHKFELEVLDVYNDNFSLTQFGELDFIDSVKGLQNGERVRFPLYYNGDLLNFEIDVNDPTSLSIDLKELLLIYVNGILQIPGESYDFDGGTTIIFTSAPAYEDDIDIFFYRGTRGVDSRLQRINEIISIGDLIQIKADPNYPLTRDQRQRRIFDIRESDLIETNIYTGPGINTVGDAESSELITDTKFVDIIPQKSDLIINGDPVSRSRNRLASRVYPTSAIIKDISTSDTEIFVEDSQSFLYEQNDLSETITEFGIVISDSVSADPAKLNVTVSSASTISSIGILHGGSGYNPGTVDLEISIPPSGIGIGIGTTAQATATVSAAGTVSSISITNGGLGYTTANSPQALVPLPAGSIENVTVKVVEGFSGIITGIASTSLSGNPAIEFSLYRDAISFGNILKVSYPIVISNTTVGTGVTSLTGAGATVGVGTTTLDNIYHVAAFSISPYNSKIGIVTCRIDTTSESSVVGIDTTGDYLGTYSWGRFSNLTRNNPKEFTISGNTVSGLTTYPQAQRRAYGLRDGGAYSN